MSKHHGSEDVLVHVKCPGSTLVIVLSREDTAWNPASTKDEKSIRGPATVTYTRHHDGGIRAVVEP